MKQMKKTLPSIIDWKNLFLVVLSLSILYIESNGQTKVDLEVKVQTASETARGGETFSYTITVNNIGTHRATDVILINDEFRSGKFVAGVPSRGRCDIEELPYEVQLRCVVGNIEPGDSVIISVETQISEFGDISEEKDTKIQEVWGNLAAASGWDYQGPLATIHISSEDAEDKKENNHAQIFVKLLPSKNIPPRIQVTSPKADYVLTKPVNKNSEVPIIFTVFDVDGTIRKVTASDNATSAFQYVVEEGETKYIFKGRKFTKEELAEASKDQVFIDSLATVITPHARDTYRYLVKNFTYGENYVHLSAYDSGGRRQDKTFSFMLKSGSEMNLAVHGGNVFVPGSSIIIETVTTVTPGVTPKVMLNGTDQNAISQVEMSQISKVGNTYKHRFIFRPPNEGSYELGAVLDENGEFTNIQAFDRFVVAEPRTIKITSLQNGQVCTDNEPCRVEVYARDEKGSVIHDELNILIDGQTYGSIHSSDCQMCAPKSVTLKSPYVQKGIRKIQIIAKHPYGTELGRSEMYTLNFR